MELNSARERLEERLALIVERAKAEGLCACLGTRFEKKDFTTCEESDKKLCFLSGEAVLFIGDEPGDDYLAFGVSVEIENRSVDPDKLDDDMRFAEESFESFMAELAEAEDKESFTREKIAEEKALAEKTLEEINSQVRSARRVGIIGGAVGIAILVAAAILIAIFC